MCGGQHLTGGTGWVAVGETCMSRRGAQQCSQGSCSQHAGRVYSPEGKEREKERMKTCVPCARTTGDEVRLECFPLPMHSPRQPSAARGSLSGRLWLCE